MVQQLAPLWVRYWFYAICTALLLVLFSYSYIHGMGTFMDIHSLCCGVPGSNYGSHILDSKDNILPIQLATKR